MMKKPVLFLFILFFAGTQTNYLLAGMPADNFHVSKCCTYKIDELVKAPGFSLDATTSMAVSPDGTRFAACSHGITKILDTKNWQCVQTLDKDSGGRPYYSYSVAFSPDGRRLALGSCGIVKILDTKIWECAQIFNPADFLYINCVVFSPDGRWLALCSLGSIKICDTKSGVYVKSLDKSNGCPEFIDCVAFSPDGTMLAAGLSSGIIKIWNTKNWKCVQTLDRDGVDDFWRIDSVTFSSDGRWLTSGLSNGIIKIWDTKIWECVQTLDKDRGGHNCTVYCLGFSPDDTKFASCSRDYDFILWKIISPGLEKIDRSEQLCDVSISYEDVSLACERESSLNELMKEFSQIKI